MQPGAQRLQRRQLGMQRRVDEPVRHQLTDAQRERRKAHQAAGLQGIGSEQLAHQRHTEVLLGRLKHEAGVVEFGHRLAAQLAAGERKKTRPLFGAAEQRLGGQRVMVTGAETRGTCRRADGDQRRSVQPRGDERLGLEPAPGAGAGAQCGMEALALQVNQVLRAVDVQRDAWMPLAPARHARQQPALRERRQHGEAQRLHFSLGGQRGGAHALVEQVERGLHRRAQRGAGGVEREAAAAPLEELEAELLLEVAHLLAHCAVREVQLLGRGAQVFAACRGAEGGQGGERESAHGGAGE